LQERSLINHLAKGVGRPPSGRTQPVDQGESQSLYRQITRRWSSRCGGLPVF
jgi:hypothetical protein